MANLRGWQMIFTRVEPEYSPQHKSGFQTVYSSRELPLADVKQIERRVQCFQANDPALERWQFFTLETGFVVLTHSITIESHPQIIDRNRRGGVFLAHCLIFRKEDFQKWTHNDPFCVLDRFDFVRDAPTLVERFNQAENREPRCEFEASDIGHPAGDPRWWPEAVRLVGMAEQAPALKTRTQSILLHGSSSQIQDLLRSVFQWMPRRMRLDCSFDTHVDRCMVPPGLYWAVGLPARASGWPIAIDAGSYQVGGPASTVNSGDMYLTWLRQAVAGDRSAAVAQVPVIEELSDAFQAARFPAHIVVEDEEACDAFFAVHEARVMQNLRVALGKATSPSVGNLLADYIARTGVRKSDLLGIAAIQRVPLESPGWLRWLVARARSWMIEQAPAFEGLKRSEWKAFQDLAQRAGDPVLLFWAAALGDERKLREEALSRMNVGEFRSSLELLARPIAATSFVAPQHVAILVAAAQPVAQDMDDEHFVELVKAVIAAGGAPYLDSFAGRIARMENRELVGLEKELSKTSGIAEGFLQAIAARRDELGPQVGLIQKLAALPKLLSGKQAPSSPVEESSADSDLIQNKEVLP
jgi:hypothetical protein